MIPAYATDCTLEHRRPGRGPEGRRSGLLEHGDRGSDQPPEPRLADRVPRRREQGLVRVDQLSELVDVGDHRSLSGSVRAPWWPSSAGRSSPGTPIASVPPHTSRTGGP